MTKVVLISKQVDDLQVDVIVDVEGAKEALEFADVVGRPVEVVIKKAEPK